MSRYTNLSEESKQRILAGSKRSAELSKERSKKKYYSNPTICKQCSKVVPYEKWIVHRKRSFCSSSCSATHNNQKRAATRYLCRNCGNPVKHGRSYCNSQCRIEYNKIERIQKIESAGKCSNSTMARRYLIEKYGNLCFTCKNTTWNGEQIPVTVDHIDGNYRNNNLSNLRLLCWNCHAQTETFGIKNRGNGRDYRREARAKLR